MWQVKESRTTAIGMVRTLSIEVVAGRKERRGAEANPFFSTADNDEESSENAVKVQVRQVEQYKEKHKKRDHRNQPLAETGHEPVRSDQGST